MGRPLRFTFKTQKPMDGLGRANHAKFLIKLKRRTVGVITSTPPHYVRMEVYTKIDQRSPENSKFSVVELGGPFASADAAKAWVSDNAKDLIKKYLFKKN